MNPAQRLFYIGWAFGMAGLLTGVLGAGGVVAGPLTIVGGALLAGSGLLIVTGEGGSYRGWRLTPFFGAITIVIGLGWEVFGAVVTFSGW